jgi:hypothetical protein
VNIWRELYIFAVASEFGQWSELRQAGPRSDQRNESEDLDLASSKLCLLEHENQNFVLRELQGGRYIPYGQLTGDRELSQNMLAIKYAWDSAVLARSQQNPNRTDLNVAHDCSFCNVNECDISGPTWLFDRVQEKTVLVRDEFSDTSPEYDVLSYTWGRAASNNWKTVPGVPWKIRSSTGLPVSRLFEILEKFKQRYVWVDVFCIPQDCPTAKSREVARQADIFRGAKGGIAWLHQTPAVGPLLMGIVAWSVLLNDSFKERRMAPISAPPGTFAALEELASDPWFSSTWALQEAILRPNMALIGVNEPNNTIILPYGTLARATMSTETYTVETLQQYFLILRTVASEAIMTGTDRMLPGVVTNRKTLMYAREALKLETILRENGLLGLVTPSPGSILSSLAVRTSVKPHDGFYGIQAVFGMSMQGDYNRTLESVQAEFKSHIWTMYAPVLCLSFNRPVISERSGTFLSDTQDATFFFSHSRLVEGRLSCMPPGYSKVRVRTTDDGKPIFMSSESPDVDSGGETWRYEASNGPPAHSKVVVITFGLPPMPVDVNYSKTRTELYKPRIPSKGLLRRWAWTSEMLAKRDRKRHNEQDERGILRDADRTTRLLYVGQFINELDQVGLRRAPHVYMEYYLKAPGQGHRVGAVVSDLPFIHHRVEGALTLD